MLTRHASLGALVGALLFLACNDDTREAEVVGPLGPSTEEVGPSEPMTEEVNRGPLSTASLTLPFSGQTSSSSPAFHVVQIGNGISGRFAINNPGNSQIALEGVTQGHGPAVLAWNLGSGTAGSFLQSNSANTSPAVEVITSGGGNALLARTTGIGDAVLGRTTGRGRAGVFQIQNPSSFNFALEANTNGRSHAIFGVNTGTGGGALFVIDPINNPQPAVAAVTRGTGSVLQIEHNGSSGNLALFRVNSTNRIRFTRAGKGIFNGGTQTGGADVAEAMAVEGRISAYEPGDVLVISTRSDRTVEKAGEPYSTRVIGVYATKPGVLLTERGVDESLDDLVPVGVIGVIPTKVSTENGPIRRGDLLVNGRTPGYAMRADPDRLRFGMVLGKALSEWTGPDRGVIPVLVNVK